MFNKITFLGRKIKERVLKKPTQVVIETTNYCNLNCPYCMVGLQNELVSKYGNTAHNLMSRQQGFMSEETFGIVLKNIKEFGIEKAYLHFQGEPFLNKLTPGFAKILKGEGFEVGIFTNGLAFNDENISEIAEAEIDLIRFSIDGASENTYSQNRVGGNFNKVIENMKKVAQAHRGKKTRIEWQFLALRNNEGEIETARGMAREIGVNFFVKGYRVTDESLAPLSDKYRAKWLAKPCKDIYHQLGIYWNGDVVPCCYDTDGREIMGNVTRESLAGIWKNAKYAVFRERVDNYLADPSDEPEICKNCLRWK